VIIHRTPLRERSGSTVILEATNLRREGNRFSGSGTVKNLPIRIGGRIDPATDVVRFPRMVCTLATSENDCCRAIGWKR
jgi:hypothetical protein